MPAVLTHDFFGRDALATASQLVGLGTDEQKNLFLLGNQGPDPLLYLIINPTVDKRSRMGGLMHHERTAHLLAALREALDLLGPVDRPLGDAYAAGFLCHYLLDVTMHPLVFCQQYAICDAGVEGLDRSNGSRVHQEIERDLDEMVLFAKRGETVRTYRPYRETLAATDDSLAALDKLYFYMNHWTFGKAIDLDAFTQGVRSFRFANRAFWGSGSAKGALISRIEKTATKTPYSQYRAMAHRVRACATSDFDNREHHEWENPFTGVTSTASFWDLFEAAQARVPKTLEAFFAADGFGVDEALELTGGLNFSGMPISEDAPVGSVKE